MPLETGWYDTRVCRAICDSCGATGPMARSKENAERLAILCDWDSDSGVCAACSKLFAVREMVRKTNEPRRRSPKPKSAD